MRLLIVSLGVITFGLPLGPVAGAEENLASLRVGSEVYSNVTVTAVTVTDIYFSHARGMGNAKLKDLSPELQQRFHFDPVKAANEQRGQVAANAQFRVDYVARSVAAVPAHGDDVNAVAYADESSQLIFTGGDELIAAEVRVALDELGKVVGAVYTDDVLDRIFSRFCLGK